VAVFSLAALASLIFLHTDFVGTPPLCFTFLTFVTGTLTLEVGAP